MDSEESIALAVKLVKLLAKNNIGKKEIVVCPSFLALSEVAKILKPSRISLGAQDTFYQEEGAFTGEVSPENLKEIGCQYVIVGHSERRAMGETDKLINKKFLAVLKEKMLPIICVGETLAERKSGQSEKVILRQINKATLGISKNQNFILAYEPVWSISTSNSGQVISVLEASKMISLIKINLSKKFTNFSLIYGGSVDKKSIVNFAKIKGVKGFLVGGASLKAKSFVELIKNL